jgi:hypothetical protein
MVADQIKSMSTHQYTRLKWVAMKVPGPQVGAGHTLRNRCTLPESSTYTGMQSGVVMPDTEPSAGSCPDYDYDNSAMFVDRGQGGIAMQPGTHLVELEHAQLDLLVLVLDLLGLGVRLLLALLAATQQPRQRVQRRLVGHAALSQHRAVRQLLTTECQPLLLCGDA